MYLDKVLNTLNDSGLDYCIQNGYENMPERFPTDVDIFYRGVKENELDRIVRIAAKESGLLVIQKVAMGYFHFVYWLSPELPEPDFQLELDFQSELSKRSMPHYYLPNKLLDRKIIYRGFYIPSQLDEVIYTILRRTVKHNFTQRHLDTLLRNYNNNPVAIEGGLYAELPENVAQRIIDLIRSGSINDFERYYSVFSEYVLSQSKKNNTITKRLSQWWYNVNRMLPLRFLHPTGIDIALLAPDGGGKSTILEALKAYSVTSFSGIERMYFRPGMFKNIGQYKLNAKPEITENPNPHGRKPDGTLKSLVRFLIYLIDFALGYYIKVVPLKWKRKLVIFDRYYYDYYVDMYRYHYSLPRWVPKVFSFMIPSPAITFVLYASADVIYNRKRELTFEETQRQCKVFKDLSKTLPNAILIDVNRPVNVIVEEIVSIIIRKRSEMTKKKFK